ncbi:MAG: ABC transporter permease [Thermoplasmatota archaeon]
MGQIRNFWLMYGRNMRQLPRIPVVLVFGIVMPVIQLLLFGSLFESITQLPAFKQAWPDVNYRAYIAPAIMLFTVFVGMANSTAALIVDLRTGYFDKLRTTPARPWQVIVARLFAEMTRVFAQGLLVLLLSIALGATVITGVLGALVMLVLAVFFSGCTAGLAVMALSMKTKSDQATQSAFPLFFIALFLSSAFQAKEAMPDWLQTVVKYNPVNYLIEVLRQLMVGVNVDGKMVAEWPVMDMLIVLGVSVVAAVLLGLLNVRVYKSSVENR